MIHSIGLGGSSISQFRPDFLEKDFEFIIENKAIKCSKIMADFISPTISNLHLIDPTLDKFYVDIDCKNDVSGIFMKLISQGSAKYNMNQVPFLLKIAHTLGNTNIMD